MSLGVQDGRTFAAAGIVRLAGARITGDLDLSGAQLSGHSSDGNSLVADGVQVDGSVFLSDRDGGWPVAADGALKLVGARISGQLRTLKRRGRRE